jgi:chemotaxis protein MotA
VRERGLDKSSFLGIALAVGGIAGGLTLEGGQIAQILQPTAALIVFGGTAGAVLLQFPLATVGAALARLKGVIAEPRSDARRTIDELVSYSTQARRDGIVSLDETAQRIEDPFLRRSLLLAIDGTEPTELRRMMELELQNQAEQDDKIPHFFEAAGGFAPTVGIIGAVLGLIQVMQRLDNISEVGKGIAVAFVATIYGIGLANLFCLPAAGKLRIRIREEHNQREMILEGVLSILEGLNPRLLESKLAGFIPEAKQRAATVNKP